MKVLVVHGNLNAGGGAEDYACAIVSTLRAQGYQVGLLDCHGHRAPDGVEQRPSLLRLSDYRPVRGRHLLTYALVCRVLPRIARNYDAIICTYGEAPAVRAKTLRLMHAPCLFGTHPKDLEVLRSGLKGAALLQRRLYALICRAIARPTLAPRDGIFTVTNSVWTGARLWSRCGVEPDEVIYPRVPRNPSDPAPDAGEYAFLSLGRIVPGKQLEDAIAVLRWLRDQGIPATLEIVGRANSSYADEFIRLYRGEPGLTLTLNASQKEKRRALRAARFGLHCYRSEHFGIAVGEMISHGILPLVHSDGGVCELVTDPRLRFNDTDDLCARALRLCQMPRREQQRLALALRKGKALSKATDFENAISTCLQRFLSGPV